jgi:hypothetical protein
MKKTKAEKLRLARERERKRVVEREMSTNKPF